MASLVWGLDGAAFSTLQRRVEVLEDRMSRQLVKMQLHGNPLLDDSLRQLEARVSASETLQPKLGRRISELSSAVRVLGEEMRSQVLRIDSVDARLWDWRHELASGEAQVDIVDPRLDKLEQAVKEQQVMLGAKVRALEDKAIDKDALHRELIRRDESNRDMSAVVEEGVLDDRIQDVLQKGLGGRLADVKQLLLRFAEVEGGLEQLHVGVRSQGKRSEELSQDVTELSKLVASQKRDLDALASKPPHSEDPSTSMMSGTTRCPQSHGSYLQSPARSPQPSEGCNAGVDGVVNRVETLQKRLDDLLPKVIEHDRCTRVVLCDLVPRLCELSDARDSLRRTVSQMRDRVNVVETSIGQLEAVYRRGTSAGGPPSASRSGVSDVMDSPPAANATE